VNKDEQLQPISGDFPIRNPRKLVDVQYTRQFFSPCIRAGPGFNCGCFAAFFSEMTKSLGRPRAAVNFPAGM